MKSTLFLAAALAFSGFVSAQDPAQGNNNNNDQGGQQGGEQQGQGEQPWTSSQQQEWQPSSSTDWSAPAPTGNGGDGAAPPTPPPPPPATGENVPHDPWTGTGSASVIWHTRYHGILAMSAYGDYRSKCPSFFTPETLQRQYPGNTNQPFEVVDEWDNVGTYNQSGYSVRVPEMNKILMVFKGNYGWQDWNATLVPFLGIGCDDTCKVHAGAYEAWQELKAHTNDMARIKATQQNLVWSATGHGSGGMIAQIAALDLKYRTFAFSAQSFGSPPVFNPATAAVYDRLFETDASQRTVANDDSVPTMLPLGTGPMNYTFVNTGIHTFGTSPMYGQDYEVCVGWNMDPRCLGGNSEADHYFYFTDLGECGGHYTDTYDTALNARILASESSHYAATASAPLGTPVTAFSSMPEPTSTSTMMNSSMATANASDADPLNNAVAAITSAEADSSASSKYISSALAGLAFVFAFVR